MILGRSEKRCRKMDKKDVGKEKAEQSQKGDPGEDRVERLCYL